MAEEAPAEVKPIEQAPAASGAGAAPEPARDPRRENQERLRALAADPDKFAAELDSITHKVRKNEGYRTRKEVEAYYKGRESIAQPASPAQAPEAPAKPEPPKREQFGTYEEYLRADAAYTAEQKADERFEKREKEASEKSSREAAQKRAQDFQGKVREKYPDFDQRLADVGDMPMHLGVQEAISESEFGPDILNELVGKPQELERLSKLSESSAVREIGKMEARLEALKAPALAPANPDPKAVKEPSRAPAPIAPVSAPRGAGNENDLSRLTDKPEEWAKQRNRELHKRRTGT